MPKSRAISILACLFLAVSLPAERIVCLGDSLTAGYGLEPGQAWPALLEEMLRDGGRDVKVVNAGLSGDTSAGGLRRADWILRQPVDVLVVALGANDALRGLPVEATRDNLRGIVLKARAAWPQVTVVLAGMKAPPNMGEAYLQAFDAVYPALAEELGLVLVPFLLEGVAAEPDLNLEDGIHPNAEGQRAIAGRMARVLAGEG